MVQYASAGDARAQLQTQVPNRRSARLQRTCRRPTAHDVTTRLRYHWSPAWGAQNIGVDWPTTKHRTGCPAIR